MLQKTTLVYEFSFAMPSTIRTYSNLLKLTCTKTTCVDIATAIRLIEITYFNSEGSFTMQHTNISKHNAAM